MSISAWRHRKYIGRTGRMGSWTALVLLISALTAPALAADLKRGAELYQNGDYAGAIQEWRPLAEQNDPNALFNMGQVYRLGRGVQTDLSMARQFYERAAVLGHVAAQNYLGTLLYFAEEPVRDAALALKWWQIAAANGEAGAQYMLGVLYFNGDTVAKDWPRAYAWMSLAAAAALPEAQTAESEMLRHLSETQKAEGRALASGLVTAEASPTGTMAPIVPNPAPEDSSAAIPPAAEPAAAPEPAAEPEPEPQPQPENDSAAVRSSWHVQLAALRSEADALAAWQSLTARHGDVVAGLTPYIERADLGARGIFYRLYAGPAASRAVAGELCAALTARQQGCMVKAPQ